MKFNTDFVAGIGYIFFMVGIAWANVGDMSGPSEPYSWWLPWVMLGITGFPFLLGYLAGRSSKGGQK